LSDVSRNFPFEQRIRDRAAASGITLGVERVEALAHHARAVIAAPASLHLSAIRDPGEFLERHLGEAFEGAAMLSENADGKLIDLGSGNGYPGLALAAARPRLNAALVEVSERKSEFLATVVGQWFPGVVVDRRHVQRAPDLEGLVPVRVIATRAMGGWERILPRLAPSLGVDGELLVWAGDALEKISSRAAWGKLKLHERRALPGRERSWVWRFGSALCDSP
jgi:16S rRNA (guanine527-N7)-methyltransferase